MNRQVQAGFTLIELVVVIVLLGLLAATALPRFLDVTDQAQSAAVEGVAGGFATGVSLVKAQWVADGNSSGTGDTEVILDGVSFFANENGWPANTTGGAGSTALNGQTAAECLAVWNNVLQNPPRATAGTIDEDDKYSVDVVSSNPDQCTYTLIVNGELDERMFFYNLGTGSVTVQLTTP